MKRFTLIFLSIFMMGALMAQQGQGSGGTYTGGNMGTQGNTVLYEQMNPQSYHVASQQFLDINNSVAQVADDFTVPADKYWIIDHVECYGQYFGGTPAGPATAFTVEIYVDDFSNGLIPASTPIQVRSELTYSEASGLFTIDLGSAPFKLLPGHYWISIYAEQNYSSAKQWGWAWSNDPQVGNMAVNRDPDHVITNPTWPDTWDMASTTWPTTTEADLSFRLIGADGSSAVPVSNWAIIFGVLLIGIFMTVRYRRSLA